MYLLFHWHGSEIKLVSLLTRYGMKSSEGLSSWLVRFFVNINCDLRRWLNGLAQRFIGIACQSDVFVVFTGCKTHLRAFLSRFAIDYSRRKRVFTLLKGRENHRLVHLFFKDLFSQSSAQFCRVLGNNLNKNKTAKKDVYCSFFSLKVSYFWISCRVSGENPLILISIIPNWPLTLFLFVEHGWNQIKRKTKD